MAGGHTIIVLQAYKTKISIGVRVQKKIGRAGGSADFYIGLV